MQAAYDIVPASETAILQYLNGRGVLATVFSLATLLRCPTAAHPEPKNKNGAYMIWHHAEANFYIGWSQAWDTESEWAGFCTSPPTSWTASQCRFVETAKQQSRELQQKDQQEAVRSLTELYASLTECGDSHPYLKAKEVRPHPALRLCRKSPEGSFPWLDNSLIVPYYIGGTLATLQRIPQAKELWSQKLLYRGASKLGAYLVVEPEHDTGKCVGIAEGFATADSYARLAGMPVYAAIDAGNMQYVAKAVARVLNGRKLVIVADNDCENKKNTGVEAALAAAKNSGVPASIAIPVQGDISPRAPLGTISCDFNDLWQRNPEIARHQALNLRTPEDVAIALGARRDGRYAEGFPPGFSLESSGGEAGLYFRKETRTSVREVRVGDVLEVVAGYKEYEDGSYGKIVQFVPKDKRTTGEDEKIRLYIQDEALSAPHGNKVIENLPGYSWNREQQDLLPIFINNFTPSEYFLLFRKPGWVGKDFLFPGKEAVIEGKTCLFPDGAQCSFFESQGTLQEWKNNVAALAAGNSRAVLAVSEAFAAPLRTYLGGPAADDVSGWHIMGGSGIGKSTCLNLGASTYGMGQRKRGAHGAVESWLTTANNLEKMCAAHNHLCLFLDEMKLAVTKDSAALAQMAYILSNGVGKGRMTQDKPYTWRIGFVSTGERSLMSFIESGGGVVHGGQKVRVCDIPSANLEENLFEDIHGCSSSKVFVDLVNNNVLKYYGTALPAFLSALSLHGVSQEDQDFYLGVQGRAFFGVFEDSGGDAQRVADTMVYNRLAIHLAIKWGILPWDEATECCMLAQCFYAWREAALEATPKTEEQECIERWTRLIQENRHRFADPSLPPARQQDFGVEKDGVFYFWPGTFKAHCKDKLQWKYELRILRKAGMMPIRNRSQQNRLVTTVRIKGLGLQQMYGVKLPEENDVDESAAASSRAKVIKMDFTKGYMREPREEGQDPGSFPEPDENTGDLPF
ncbi:MAG: DUF927 domain-containing protein [Bacteroides sp.]|nr:DUF927 domain-containing protein [Bacteroides sp.]